MPEQEFDRLRRLRAADDEPARKRTKSSSETSDSSTTPKHPLDRLPATAHTLPANASYKGCTLDAEITHFSPASTRPSGIPATSTNFRYPEPENPLDPDSRIRQNTHTPTKFGQEDCKCERCDPAVHHRVPATGELDRVGPTYPPVEQGVVDDRMAAEDGLGANAVLERIVREGDNVGSRAMEAICEKAAEGARGAGEGWVGSHRL